MAYMRKQYEAAFKARVALEAVKGEKTIAQIASESGAYSDDSGHPFRTKAAAHRSGATLGNFYVPEWPD